MMFSSFVTQTWNFLKLKFCAGPKMHVVQCNNRDSSYWWTLVGSDSSTCLTWLERLQDPTQARASADLSTCLILFQLGFVINYYGDKKYPCLVGIGLRRLK